MGIGRADAPAASFTPVRLDYILQTVRRTGLASPEPGQPLAGLAVLDIGCGGGAGRTCRPAGSWVTAIDGSAGQSGRQLHAQKPASWQSITSIALPNIWPKPAASLIWSMPQVIEHVADPDSFAEAIAAMLKPSGAVVITTINRTLAAAALAKFAAEYILRMVPAGTHQMKNSSARRIASAIRPP